jgi:hypothetical protein
LTIGAVVFGCLDGHQFPALFAFPMNIDHGTALLGRGLSNASLAPGRCAPNKTGLKSDVAVR